MFKNKMDKKNRLKPICVTNMGGQQLKSGADN